MSKNKGPVITQKGERFEINQAGKIEMRISLLQYWYNLYKPKFGDLFQKKTKQRIFVLMFMNESNRLNGLNDTQLLREHENIFSGA